MLRSVGVNVDALPLLDVRQPGATDIIGDRALGSEPMQVAALGRGECRPFGRLHSGDSAALLVDEDWEVGAPGQLAQRIGQPQHLLLRVAVALEQDEAGGIGVAEEAALAVGHFESLEAVDCRLHQPSSIARRNNFRRPP
jgi:hypothetical protein